MMTDIYIDYIRDHALKTLSVNPHSIDAHDKLALIREIEDLRQSVIAFGGPWAAEYAENFGLPKGHLHPTHYDILTRAGARMVDFIRAEITSDNTK